MTTCPRLVILGSTLTALAVARNAADRGMRPIVIDTESGVAMATWRAEVHVLADARSDAVLAELARVATEKPGWLIATSDRWLRFIVKHRIRLQELFAEILHPDSVGLAICLGKTAFSQWCSAQNLPTPRLYDEAHVLAGSGGALFPLLLRPSESSHSPGVAIPKAVEVHDRAELLHWLNVFRAAGSAPLITESLLGRPITQYSVGAARRGGALMTFVAIKQRPLPEVCGVGSFVELCPDDAIEMLARTALNALDYHGIAEVEILRDEDSRRDYLIEINARPWVQYSLGPASGHDPLAFLLDPNGFDPRNSIKSGKRWLNLTADLYGCFSQSLGTVRNGKIPFGDWLISVLRANTYAHFAIADPRPAWRNTRDFLSALTATRR